MKQPRIMAYGGGVNSVAMLVGLVANDQVPDAILFADTGGEWPETYAYNQYTIGPWLAKRGCPELITVRNNGKYESLEDNCLTKEMLPSLAYGFRSCSEKYKHRPQHQWAKRWQPAIDCWATGGRVLKYIGYSAEESRRSDITGDGFYEYHYPLREWGWDRKRCKVEILRAGLPLPRKSSCFFCPAMKKWEIRELAERHPELFQRALEMESRAAPNLKSVAGLGRRFAWGDLDIASLPQEANLAAELRDIYHLANLGCHCQPEIEPGDASDQDEEPD